MGRRSRVIPCGTAPWRVPGAGRLRGRRTPRGRGRGRVAASRSPDSSGGFPSGAGGQHRAGRRGRSPPRRSRVPWETLPGSRRALPVPEHLKPRRAAGGRARGRCSGCRPTKDGRSHTLPALAVQPLRWRCGRCARARPGSPPRSRVAAGNRVAGRCCLSFHTPLPGHSRAPLHSARGPCAASDRPPLLAAQPSWRHRHC